MPKRKVRESRRTPSSAYCGDRQRQRRIEAVLLEVARRIDTGGAVDVAELERTHEDLMPELASDLRMLLAARQGAQADAQAPAPHDAIEEVLDEELKVLRQTLDHYELLERVRYGGQGVVYRARQCGTNRIVALKVLLDGPLATERQRARFAREIEVVSRLRHPNIVTVYDSGVVRGRNFYAMEFVEGDPIDDYAALADMTPHDIVRLLVKVCRAVQHAHQNGIIHRDLNPSNILVDRDGEPRIYDFGLAKDLWAEGQDARYSMTGVGCGTLPYLSPEQAGAGDGLTDVRSDVYAIGLVLYELLTDMFPYPIRGEPSVVRRAIIQEEPLPLRRALAQGSADWAPQRAAVDQDLEAILVRALAKSKDDRYQTAGALAADLERWLDGDAVAARAGSRIYLLRKVLRRHKIAVGFAAVIAAAVTVSGIGITYYWLQARAERDNARRAAGVAYDLFDTSLTDVEEAVRPLAGGVAVRDRLIGRLSDKLPALERLAKSDPALDRVVARLLEKQGDIALQQGQRTAAAQYYRAFLDDSLQRVKSSPNDAGAAAAVIRGYRKLGEASDEPAPQYEQGARFGAEFLHLAPRDEAVRYELCGLLSRYAGLLRNAGRVGEALPQYERVLELCPFSNDPATLSDQWVPVVADALNGEGLTLGQLGQALRGRRDVERALTLREQAVAQAPANTEKRLALLQSYMHLGTLCRDAGQLEDAKRFLRQAAEQVEFLAMLDASFTGEDVNRYAVHHRLASLCLDTGDLDEASVECETAVAIAERLSSVDSTEEAQMERHFALMLRGKLRKAEGDLLAALQDYRDALAVRQRSLDQHPGNASIIAQVAAAHDAIAASARALGDLALALQHRIRLHELQKRVCELQPGVVESELNLIASQNSLAQAHLDLGTPEHWAEAECLLEQSERRLADLESGGKLIGSERKHERTVRAMQERRETLDQQRPSLAEGQTNRAEAAAETN
jgi:eukaryotic-like serine/threonine-protein kinase